MRRWPHKFISIRGGQAVDLKRLAACSGVWQKTYSPPPALRAMWNVRASIPRRTGECHLRTIRNQLNRSNLISFRNKCAHMCAHSCETRRSSKFPSAPRRRRGGRCERPRTQAGCHIAHGWQGVEIISFIQQHRRGEWCGNEVTWILVLVQVPRFP